MLSKLQVPLRRFFLLLVAVVVIASGFTYIYKTVYATPTSSGSLDLVDTAWENSDDRTVLQCTPSGGTCTANADLFNNLSFSCPTGASSCSATITVSLAHNCTENVPYINLKMELS